MNHKPIQFGLNSLFWLIAATALLVRAEAHFILPVVAWGICVYLVVRAN
jgi:hypothetical protein